MDIEVHTRHEAIEIDTANKTVLVADLDHGTTRRHHFDHLLIATGSTPIRPHLPGSDAVNIHDVNSLAGGIALKQALQREKPRSAVIVGGGYIGIEMAEALIMRGLQVHLIQRGDQVMSSLDAEPANLVGSALERHGVNVHLGQTVVGFETINGRAVRVITDQATLAADIFLLGLGVRPNSALAGKAGIPLGAGGAIAINDRQQTKVPTIWAAGDCAESFHLVGRRPVFFALGTIANKQGRVAGINLAGGEARFPGVVGTAITKFMDTEIARTGLSEREIKELNIPFVTGLVEAHTLPRYYPGSAPMTVKVLAEQGPGRLLGAQIVGGAGAGKRIDPLAVALHAGFTLDDLLYLDLGYAPPFSGVWEPFVIAARLALKKS
ncbi:MAG: FAD-dependent oxidoreductase [Desulfobulbaceae bacterium]|uniref:Pyridine nucleotide-disulphide oxidoreductase, dimerisation domain n=2 Tax=Desulfofustis glycolicus TaxID=51195 RepID=A0A1M5V8L0_9BACT|nr:FAD-dependent oxidoreductase [Desulfobulbaceae bacterium]SHH71540.1 Pyridine nucleotide-disulphide oxidoreductase, dimerisation domain [Desulfofustis glycolicus DSM 9705]